MTQTGYWKTGIVQSLIKSTDGFVRAANVKYFVDANITYVKRPENKLYLLEASNSPIKEVKIKFCVEDSIEHLVMN